MRKITIKEAAGIMQISEQCLRMMIRRGCFPGAIVSGTEKKRTYYLTDVMVENIMNGKG